MRSIAPAAVLSLALLGDALLYLVLPIHTAAFGVSLAWVGVLLAANRLVRIVGYGVIADLARRLGPRRLTLAATGGAIVSTAAYGLAQGAAPLLAARLVWGLSFAALNLTMLAYAVADAARAGRRVGMSRAVSGFGPMLALTVGAWASEPLGPQGVFVALAFVSAAALPVAWTLPDIRAAEAKHRRGRVARPSALDVWAFGLGFAVDGVFVITLSMLLGGLVSASSAVIAGGLLLALRRLVEVLLAPLGGVIGDRFGAGRMMLVFGLVLAAGLALIALGTITPGAVLVVLAHGVLTTIGPVLAAERAPDAHLERLAAFATWRDIGAAAGPLAAGALAETLPLSVLYAGLTLFMLAALLPDVAGLARRSPPGTKDPS